MARKSLASFSRVLRNLSSFRELPVVNPCLQRILRRQSYPILTFHRHFVAPVANSVSNLEEALKSRDIDQIYNARDLSRDVYARGFLYSQTDDEVRQFFEDAEMEELHALTSEKALTKMLHYIRFKDGESKQKGLAKHKQNFGDRYIEVIDVKDFKALGTFLLADTSSVIMLSNLPFSKGTGEIMSWLDGLGISVKSVEMLPNDRSKCLAELSSSDEVVAALKHNRQMFDGRKISMKPFIPGKILKSFREKYAST